MSGRMGAQVGRGVSGEHQVLMGGRKKEVGAFGSWAWSQRSSRPQHPPPRPLPRALWGPLCCPQRVLCPAPLLGPQFLHL